MPLDLVGLQTAMANAFRTNFQLAVDEEWDADRSADELATAIADAVDAYVRGAEVAGIATEVVDVPGTTVIGSGSQTAPASLS